jgi:hypothetical protein
VKGVDVAVAAACTPPAVDVPPPVVPVPPPPDDDVVGVGVGVGVTDGSAGTQPPTIGTSMPPTHEPVPLVPIGVEGPHVSVPLGRGGGGKIEHCTAVWVTEVPVFVAGEISSVSVPNSRFPAEAPVTPLIVQVHALLVKEAVDV